MRSEQLLLLAETGYELGDIPPIVIDADVKGLPDHRRVSLRWLASTVLAAVASTSLMGVALFTAMEGRRHPPVSISSLSRLVNDDPAILTHHDVVAKGDILAPAVRQATGRQIIKVSMVTKDGDKEVVRVRPLARVTVKLANTYTIPEANIPKFDPLTIFADANRPPESTSTDSIYGAAGKGDYTLKVHDFPFDGADTLDAQRDLAHAEMAVRAEAAFLGAAKASPDTVSAIDPQRFGLGYAENDTLDRLGVQLTAENISNVAQSTGQSAAATPSEERVLTGDDSTSLFEILVNNETTDEDAARIVEALQKNFGLTQLTSQDHLRVRLSPAGDADVENRYRPDRIAYFRGTDHVGTLALDESGAFVPTVEDRPSIDLTQAASDEGRRPRLYDSLYETAVANNVPPDVIRQLIHIYALDVDFSARVGDQDSVEFIYTNPAEAGQQGDPGQGEAEPQGQDVIFASITVSGRTHRFYRFRTPDDNTVDYFDASGSSARKFLMRKPVTNATFRSGFGMRIHPLFGEPRMHTGVDWAAPRGTPIMAAGDGVVSKADWVNGYGRLVRIEHTNGYATQYAHMSGFAPGIGDGTHVRQGQVIGYIGTTGNVTGPHVHFEILVNGRQVDPMRVKLPQGRSLQGEVLTAFSAERTRIDSLTASHPAPGTLADSQQKPPDETSDDN